MSEIVMVRSFEVRKTRNQDSFGSLRVSLGRAGDFVEVDAKIWCLDGYIKGGNTPPAAGDLLEVQYKADDYQGRPQWIIQSFRILAGRERERALESFTPQVRIDAAFYRQRLDELIERTSPERPAGLILREIFDSPSFREAFYLAPAARDHHQNYPGGLLEHTVNVTCLALCAADAYATPGGGAGLTFNRACLPLDRQTLIAAGLLHDIGKLQTYAFTPLPEVTEDHQWEGHLSLGYAAVRRVAEPYLLDPAYAGQTDEVHKLLHCILSHHGQLEYGSPVLPACAEAFILAQADMTDARLAEIASAGAEARARDPKSRWLRNHYHFKSGLFIGEWGAEGESGEKR
jgi:3'-5' exoribonuclease